MSPANVRCAGRPTSTMPWDGPCGWKGERFPSVPMWHSEQDATADFKRKATRKPCPRCGGKVALIERDDQ